ncbi:MAG TPA: DUF1285 domain-containing protein [Candidatus Sulfotelmatobacter sp.]|nr:DUF1285 domain-containing protein [Candidatus Sulfotelmatobacter sp.]
MVTQSSSDPAALIAALRNRKLPPVHSWNPAHCGPSDMRIARDGTWSYRGSPIGRMPMVRLFSTVLRRDADDVYYLVTPVEKLTIEVEDVPFLAVEMLVEGSGRGQRLSFRTNVDDAVLADAAHPIRVVEDAASGEPSPYVLVRDRLEARIVRSVFYDLVELGGEAPVGGETQFGVWSAGVFFPIGKLDG